MDTIEQKEKDTIELRKLTKFQKKQVLSLVADSSKRMKSPKRKVSRHAQNAARLIPYLRRWGGQKEASRCTSAMNVEGGSLRI